MVGKGKEIMFSSYRVPDITAAMKILIIEDDTETADYVAKGLEEAGHTVDVARDGKNGLVMIVGEAFDAAIVDRMLPGIDGKTIVETVRGAGKTTPILLLSAMGEVRHRVEGLHSGADDYLIKPFAFSELLARVEALGRRPKEEFRDETVLRVGDLEVNRLTRDVARSGQKIDLQPREYRLLEYLMRHAGRVVTRTMLLEHVWDYHFDPQTNVIDVHVSRLRQKIDKDFKIPLLHTVRGAGYSLRAADSTS